jgi:PAS domain S-box-containing protein
MAEMTNMSASVSVPSEVRRPRPTMDTPAQRFPFGANSAVARYGLAILSVVASLLLRRLADPLLGPQNTYHTAWAAVVFTSWYCGLGPAILSVVLTAIGSVYYFVAPVHSFAIRNGQDVWGLISFLLFSSLIVVVGEANRRSIARREAAEREASEIRSLLEERIQQRTQELENTTAQVQHQARLLDSANDAIFVRSKDNRITYWNRGATRLYGWEAHEVMGRSMSEVLQTEFPVPISEVLYSENDSWEGELRHRKRDGSRVTVASRWTTLRDAKGEVSGWLEINTDITRRKQAEEAARRLGGRMLQLQDAERRKFARELHDGVGQYLASIKIMLDGAMRSEIPQDQQREMLAQGVSILDRCLVETRTVSHLLHPPLLDEAGLASAVQWYAEGFSKRSGIHLDLDLQLDQARLPSEVEITLFRVLQESLTNIHRHSGASKASVSIFVQDGDVRMQVTDSGCGIPEVRLRQWREMRAPLGVGMAGMLERTRELGGSFDVQSDNNGTTVTVDIPVGGAVTANHSAAPERKDSAQGNSAA